MTLLESKKLLKDALKHFEASVEEYGPFDTPEALDEILKVHQAVKATVSRVISEQEYTGDQVSASLQLVKTSTTNFADAVMDQERFIRVRSKVQEDSETKIIAVRVPKFLDHYIAAWVSRAKEGRSRRREITKQEVITEALCMFYAAHTLPPVPDEEYTR